MQFKLSSNWLSLGANFQIKNAKDQLAYEVRGKFFSFGHDLRMYDDDGIEVARIRQNLRKYAPTYDIYIGEKEQPYATIVKEFSWFKKCFLLDVPGPNDYEIEGNFWNFEYQFRRFSQVVATVSKRMFTIATEYGIAIDKGEDPVQILAAAVVIAICNQQDALQVHA